METTLDFAKYAIYREAQEPNRAHGIKIRNHKVSELICAAHNLRLINYDPSMKAFTVHLENVARYIRSKEC